MKAPTTKPQEKVFEHYLMPDNNRPCSKCKRTPTINYCKQNGELLMRSPLCGACFFGAETFYDPKTWADKLPDETT